MSELLEFVKKRTAKFSGISGRKLYGLDAFYLNDIPFIVITANDQVVVKVEDFEVKKAIVKIPQVTQWTLNDKAMENWFLLPDTFNKKKNKLTPVLDMTSKVLLNPKKEKKKRKNKPNSQKKSIQTKSKPLTSIVKEPSLIKRIINRLF